MHSKIFQMAMSQRQVDYGHFSLHPQADVI